MPSFLLCMHPLARDAALALLALLLILVLVYALLHRASRAVFAVCGAFLALSLWLGSYRISPLGFSTGRVPLLAGFWVTRPDRPRAWVAPRQVVSIAPGSAMGIEPQLLPAPADCLWSSSNGGAFDDPAECDTDYTPGQGAPFDILRVAIRPACGLPPTVGEMRISILP